MHTKSKLKVTLEHKQAVGKMLIDYPETTKENLKLQQSNYMRKYGKKPALNVLAAILLETAQVI